MTDGAFSPLMRSQEEGERRGAVLGLRFAEVVRLEDEGYILDWLSGNVSTESAPARVATMMAGAERGTFFMPEAGDEVVVGFEDGDLDRPIILGALWSDQDAPPTQADASESNNIRTIVSRAGHQLTFDDSPGGEKIVIETKGKLKITMDDVKGSITIAVDGSNQIEISSAGVTVKGTTINLN